MGSAVVTTRKKFSSHGRSFVFFVSCVSHAFTYVHCCLVVTCWERTDLLALVGDVYCNCVTFPCDILGQVWYLIVSFPDLCHPSYFLTYARIITKRSNLFKSTCYNKTKKRTHDSQSVRVKKISS